MKPFSIPLAETEIQPEDVAAVAEVVKSKRLSMGPALDAFESRFAEFIGTRHAVAVSSGTAGLHLCMRVLGLNPGDEVITSPFSFISSSNCVLFEDAKPVFADIEEETLNISPGAAALAVTERTRALLPVHVFGQAGDMEAYLALADRHGLALVEDACEAVGGEYRGRKLGTFGQTAVFSFYPNKQITTGEGAMITTSDSAIAARLRSLRNQGRNESGGWLQYERLGFNYRLDEMSAALGNSQLGRIGNILEKRARAASLYHKRLAGMTGVRLPRIAAWTSIMSWFVFVIRLEAGISRSRVMQRMEENGILTRDYFSPIHLQPFMREKFGYRPGDFPVAERVAASTLALPFFNSLTEAQVDHVAMALEEAIQTG